MAGWLSRLLFPTSDAGADDPLLTPAQARQLDLIEQLQTMDPWQLPTVVAGRQLCADTTAMMALVATTDTGRVDPTPAVCRRPDPSEPYRRTMERIVNSLTRHGMAWLRVNARGANGWPLAVEVVDHQRVTWQLSPNGARIVQLWLDGQPIDRDELRYIPMTSDDGPIGRSPLAQVQTALDQLCEVYRFSSTYYTTAAVPPYSLVHPNRLTAVQANELATQWQLARLERRPALLSGGIQLETYTPQSAADALLLDAINYLDAVVARVLLIPPSLLNVLSQSSLTYSNTQDELRRWLSLGLYPMFLARIEAGFSDLLPRGQKAVFDTSNLTRMDLSGRIDAYSTALAAGIYSPAEVRVLEGLPPVPAAQPVAVQPNVEGL